MIQLKEYELKMVPTTNQLFSLGCFILDDEGNIGYVQDMTDKHKIEVTFTSGLALYCINKNCEEMDTNIRVVEPYLLDPTLTIHKDDYYYCKGSETVKIATKDCSYICDTRVIGYPNEIGSVYTSVPHDRAIEYKKGGYLEELHPSMLLDLLNTSGRILVEVEEICPHYGGTHIGKDCSCKSGFILRPRLKDKKVILYPKPLNKESKQLFYIYA